MTEPTTTPSQPRLTPKRLAMLRAAAANYVDWSLDGASPKVIGMEGCRPTLGRGLLPLGLGSMKLITEMVADGLIMEGQWWLTDAGYRAIGMEPPAEYRQELDAEGKLVAVPVEWDATSSVRASLGLAAEQSEPGPATDEQPVEPEQAAAVGVESPLCILRRMHGTHLIIGTGKCCPGLSASDAEIARLRARIDEMRTELAEWELVVGMPLAEAMEAGNARVERGDYYAMMRSVDRRSQCTAGDGCPVHPNVHVIHHPDTDPNTYA